MTADPACVAVARILDMEILIDEDIWLSSSGISYSFKGSTFMQLTGPKMDRGLWDKLSLVQSSGDPMPIPVSIGSKSENTFMETLRLKPTLINGRWTSGDVTVLLGKLGFSIARGDDREFWQLDFVV